MQFSIIEFDRGEGRIIFSALPFENTHDFFSLVGEAFVFSIKAKIVEEQLDADLYSWLLDFKGNQLLLRAEYYSNSIWLETLSSEHEKEVLELIANLFPRMK